MDDAQLLVLELGSKGYSCAQMVLIGGLRLMGRDNPDLVRAMSGLAQGVGLSGEICGALAGGACLIGLHMGKGLDSEEALPEGQVLMDELLQWFREELCQGGSVTCDAILGTAEDCAKGDASCRGMDPARCGALVAATWSKAVTLLAQADIDPAQGREVL
ncbi:C-GCAxxG-C-C family protein [Desulfovibrio sp. OttesenSCG-928-M16]|nr:C-GCAxxG-C-C family protein [Desulfovibrio sp. OttesenSCG-928-M16]